MKIPCFPTVLRYILKRELGVDLSVFNLFLAKKGARRRPFCIFGQKGARRRPFCIFWPKRELGVDVSVFNLFLAKRELGVDVSVFNLFWKIN